MRLLLLLTVISGIFSSPIFAQFRTSPKVPEAESITNKTINRPAFRPTFSPKNKIDSDETNTNDKNTTVPIEKIKKTFVKYPPYFSVITRWGVSSIIGGAAPIHSNPNMWLIFEGMIPLNSKKIYLYTQVRMSAPLSYTKKPVSDILPIMNMENTRMGILIGLGGHVIDNRNNNGVGWHYTVNSGFVLEGAIANNNATKKFFLRNIEILQDRFLNIGSEINFRATYSFHRRAGFVMGFDVGYLRALQTGDPFYVNLKKAVVSFDTINFSATIGFNF